MEETYWKNGKAADEAHYMSLWHENFRGWPRDQASPVGMQGLGEAVQGKFARKGTLDYEILSQAVPVTGSIGITQYAVRSRCTKTDGRKDTFDSRITHTWLKTETGWKIIGGLSAPVESAGHTW
jgi:ketosteroid isomerase-like protein